MSNQSKTQSETGTHNQSKTQSETGTQTLEMERTFDATPEEVWAAWTEAEQFAKWISPFPAVDAEVPQFEAREGGTVRFTMIDDNGHRFPEEVSTFLKLEKPHHLVMYQANDDRDDFFKGFPIRMEARFDRVGDKTLMKFVQTGLPAKFPIEEARKGFTACFDQLAEVIKANQE